MMNANDPPVPPPEALKFLDDPRLADLRYLGPEMSPDSRLLKPSSLPAAGESRFLLFSPSMAAASSAKVTWTNKPKIGWQWGKGRGFSGMPPLPRFEEQRKKPKSSRSAWTYLEWIIASPQFTEIVTKFDPAAIETRAIDWMFSDGQQLDGYQFLDVLRLIHAYDYDHSEISVHMIAPDKKHIADVGPRCALKTNIDLNVHIFRDAYIRRKVFVSRELIAALIDAGIRQVNFIDPATG
jgi:hypothetical protein